MFPVRLKRLKFSVSDHQKHSAEYAKIKSAFIGKNWRNVVVSFLQVANVGNEVCATIERCPKSKNIVIEFFIRLLLTVGVAAAP